MVVAPAVVRPGLPYAVSFNILKSPEEDHIVRVQIRTEQNDTVATRVVKNVRQGTSVIFFHSELTEVLVIAQ